MKLADHCFEEVCTFIPVNLISKLRIIIPGRMVIYTVIHNIRVYTIELHLLTNTNYQSIGDCYNWFTPIFAPPPLNEVTHS